MSNQIPEKLINVRVYKDGNVLLGVADVELPSIEFLTDTVSGAGIAGEVDSPVMGHTKSMSVKIKFRTVTANSILLHRPESHHLDIRGSLQFNDAGTGKLVTKAVKVVLKSIPKSGSLGKMEMGKPQDVEHELEVTYLKMDFDGVEALEVDKFNYIFRVQGEDFLAAVRKDLGMEG